MNRSPDTKEQSKKWARYQVALQRRRQWDSVLAEAYRYALPHHGQRTEKTPKELFDNTAVTAVNWKRARLHGLLFPPFRPWMDFVAHDLLLRVLGSEAAQSWLALIRERFHCAIEHSNFHQEIAPALAEACLSTGSLLLNAGTAASPLIFETIPLSQIIPEEGVDNRHFNLYRRWSLPRGQLLAKWPDIEADHPVLKSLMRSENHGEEQELEIVEAFLSDHKGPAQAGCHYEVWLATEGEASLLTQRCYDVSPALLFRMDKAPAEVMGRGPVLSVLGDIKTANKVVELTLKNATIAATGIWQAEDDGVLNLANIRLVPGTIIPKAVGSAGLTPLEAPGRFDVSQLVLERLQEAIRRGIMGPELPAASQGVRTAEEISRRGAEQDAVALPEALRLLNELAYPLAERVVSILSSPAMAGSPFYLPLPPMEEGQRVKLCGLLGQKNLKASDLLRPQVLSPLVQAQDRLEAQQLHQALSGLQAAFPGVADQVVDVKASLQRLLKLAGFPQDLMAPSTRG